MIEPSPFVCLECRGEIWGSRFKLRGGTHDGCGGRLMPLTLTEREMVRADVDPELMAHVLDVDRCGDCGEPVREGDWPFCVSERNPEGHAKGAYAFNVAMGGGGLKKWTHMGSKSPR